MAKKWLYTFSINKETETEKREKSTNEDGKEVETIEKVKEKLPVGFLIQKPTRKLYDKAELFYGVKMSEGIKAGLLTRNLLAKRYEDDGGAFSEAEKNRYSELYLAIYNKEEEYQRLQLNLENKSQELKEKLSQDLLYELSDLRRELTEIENSQSNIFDQTAENRAKNQTIMWWVLQLSHWKEHDHSNPDQFFGKGTYDEKLEAYDELEENEEDFYTEAIRKLAYFISFWYMGRINSEEDFKGVEDLYNSQNESEEDVEEARAKAEAEAEEEIKNAEKEAVEEEAKEASEQKKPAAKKKPKTVTKKKRSKKTNPKEEVSEQEKEKPANEELVAEDKPVEEKKPVEELAEKAETKEMLAETKTTLENEGE